jgi:hypothetical protein
MPLRYGEGEHGALAGISTASSTPEQLRPTHAPAHTAGMRPSESRALDGEVYVLVR